MLNVLKSIKNSSKRSIKFTFKKFEFFLTKFINFKKICDSFFNSRSQISACPSYFFLTYSSADFVEKCFRQPYLNTGGVTPKGLYFVNNVPTESHLVTF